MIDTLAIRYADPDTHPAMYRAEVKSDVVIVHGFWTLTGSLYSLRKHLERALADDNVEDFNWGGVPA